MGALLLLWLCGTVYAQDPPPVDCPDGHVCLTDEQYAAVYGKLEELAVIEDTPPTITVDDSVVVIVDRAGRVYTNGTGDQRLSGTLQWGHMGADLELGLDVDVRQREVPDFGVRLRPKTAFGILPLRFTVSDPAQMVDVGLGLDVLYYRKWNLNAYAGSRSFGVDVGFDVFRNSGVMTGVHWAYPTPDTTLTPTPGASWYFGF